MTITGALVSFGLIAALLTVIPGLDTALVLRSAITRGPRQAMTTALGVNCGALAWGVATASGASALLAASRTGYRLLTLAGAGYMVWLGVSLILASLRSGEPEEPATASPGGSGGLLRAWATGAGTNLLNPKVGVFYLATIPQFIPAHTSPLLMGVLLASVHNVLGLIWFSLIVVASRLAARRLRHPRVTRLTDRITGTVLVGFGVKLALHPR